MVDVSGKNVTKRHATARGRIYIPLVAYELVTSSYLQSGEAPKNVDHHSSPQREKSSRKGDVLSVAQLAAIMGSKKTSDLIPLCHPLSLTHVSVTLTPESSPGYSIVCEATVSCEGKTGVEMEALMAVSIGLLTVWDMLKAVAGREMRMGDIIVAHKEGGRSGSYRRE
jgi:molybdenum cofactor biosynthesis protein MoaC